MSTDQSDAVKLNDGKNQPAGSEDAAKTSDALEGEKKPDALEVGTKKPDASVDAIKEPGALKDAIKEPGALKDATKEPDASADATKEPDASADATKEPDALKDAQKPDALKDAQKPDASADATKEPDALEDAADQASNKSAASSASLDDTAGNTPAENQEETAAAVGFKPATPLEQTTIQQPVDEKVDDTPPAAATSASASSAAEPTSHGGSLSAKQMMELQEIIREIVRSIRKDATNLTMFDDELFTAVMGRRSSWGLMCHGADSDMVGAVVRRVIKDSPLVPFTPETIPSSWTQQVDTDVDETIDQMMASNKTRDEISEALKQTYSQFWDGHHGMLNFYIHDKLRGLSSTTPALASAPEETLQQTLDKAVSEKLTVILDQLNYPGIYVDLLPWDSGLGADELMAHFSAHNPVCAEFKMSKETDGTFWLITVKTTEDQQNAIEQLHDTVIEGRSSILKVTSLPPVADFENFLYSHVHGNLVPRMDFSDPRASALGIITSRWPNAYGYEEVKAIMEPFDPVRIEPREANTSPLKRNESKLDYIVTFTDTDFPQMTLTTPKPNSPASTASSQPTNTELTTTHAPAAKRLSVDKSSATKTTYTKNGVVQVFWELNRRTPEVPLFEEEELDDPRRVDTLFRQFITLRSGKTEEAAYAFWSKMIPDEIRRVWVRNQLIMMEWRGFTEIPTRETYDSLEQKLRFRGFSESTMLEMLDEDTEDEEDEEDTGDDEDGGK
ncbi:hypothetical protein BJ508DRAFT_327908 [Ascobolus immersus RN42]|uniref:Uncharacterized protein n=1 Tax=Ascobolus immersus RN42 TaxID=1160509 RepID=A0A3N4I382_ASCIM|nr:hypothetical protein BJ508DRAFT_327908 [Ascobolus immersus RN42]